MSIVFSRTLHQIENRTTMLGQRRENRGSTIIKNANLCMQKCNLTQDSLQVAHSTSMCARERMSINFCLWLQRAAVRCNAAWWDVCIYIYTSTVQHADNGCIAASSASFLGWTKFEQARNSQERVRNECRNNNRHHKCHRAGTQSGKKHAAGIHGGSE